ncbi:hypothetical protein [Sediminibacterium sp.]|uniref:hypothetical protein n=1 Tax=Sediminibacterium sp. TaxID=1917865 RepID=UPI002735B23C|nr:hypothetical protein [Sediminibacterium sp.]MDP3392408.1 hypothetical protein [Sediminibacterium sp.]MDP3565674.1 hypothetical protein [Sediminibacterium sp.]
MTLKKDFILYRFEVLFLFVLLEVLLYDKLPLVQAIISIIEYAFIFACVVFNKRVGIMYLISFTLLSMGAWSYVTQETLPYNFWGLRLFGFSANVLFYIAISFYLFFSNRFRIRLYMQNSAGRFYIYFILYSFLIGLLFTILSKNYYDNFLKDFLVYLPFFFFLYLISFLSSDDTRLILKYGIALSIIAMLISYFTGQLFDYGAGNTFVLMNAFAFSIIFPIYFFKDLFKWTHLYFLIFSVLFLLIQGKVFIGSKSIILIIFLLVWVLTSSYKVFKYFLLISFFLILLIGPLITWISQNVDPDLVVSYKFNQIFSVFEIVDLELIALSNTSMGNIVAEAITIVKWISNNFGQFLIGKGFGGGLNDTTGYLATYVGPGAGYSEIDLSRDQFTRLHLPLFEVIVKAGFLGTLAYLWALVLLFREKNIFSFSFFMILMSVFSNSKEMILLSLVFNHLAMSFVNDKKTKSSLIVK